MQGRSVTQRSLRVPSDSGNSDSVRVMGSEGTSLSQQGMTGEALEHRQNPVKWPGRCPHVWMLSPTYQSLVTDIRAMRTCQGLAVLNAGREGLGGCRSTYTPQLASGVGQKCAGKGV